MLTQSLIQQMRGEAAAAGLFGPYEGPKDKLAKLRALKNLQIPNISEEIDKLAAPLSFGDLERIVQEIEMLEAQAAYTAAAMQAQGIAMESQQMQAMAQGEEQGAGLQSQVV